MSDESSRPPGRRPPARRGGLDATAGSDTRGPTPVPGTATAFLNAGRARCLAMVGAPVLLSAVAFHDIVRVKLHHDDYLHLYDLVNLGPGLFTLTNFGGHLQLTYNAVLVALYAAFGLQAQWSMTVVGLTHLLNVALLASVVRHLTRNWAVALIAAAWWGANAIHMEALGWLSVYGQVLCVTAVLWVARLVTATAGGAPLRRTAPLRALLALVAAATSFGTGVAMTLAMPATARCLIPPGRARTRLVRAATVAAVVTVALYLASGEWNRRLFGTPPATVIVSLLAEYAGTAVQFLVALLTSGVAIALLGPFFLPLHEVSTWSTTLACGAAGAILLAGRPAWRPVLGCALLSLASYGMIALARFPLALAGVPDAAFSGRYHYAAPLGFLLVLALAVAAALDRLPARWPVRTPLAVVGYGAAVIGYLCFFPPVPRWDAVQREVSTALAGIEAAVKRNPPGADVYLPHQPFFISDLTTIRIGDLESSVPIGRFPGVAGLFALSQPSNVVDGRRVFFVVEDPAKLDAWQRGRRGAGLIVSAEEMLARGGSLTKMTGPPMAPSTSTTAVPHSTGR